MQLFFFCFKTGP
ncbi:hypothetical protein ECTW09195_2658, partial [Escherichia coli TW09195]